MHVFQKTGLVREVIGSHGGKILCWDALWESGPVSSHWVVYVGKRVLILSVLNLWFPKPLGSSQWTKVPSGTEGVQKALRASAQWNWSWHLCWWQPSLKSCPWVEAAAAWQQARPIVETQGWEWRSFSHKPTTSTPSWPWLPRLIPTVESFVSWEAPCY